MIRIAAIGNSHLDAIRRGWVERPLEGIEIDWFPQRSTGTYPLTLMRPGEGVVSAVPDMLVTRDRVIHLDAFDRFLVIGLDFTMHNLAHFYDGYRADHHAPGAAHVVSDKAFEAAAFALFDNSLAVRIARALTAATDSPVTIVINPGMSENVLLQERWPVYETLTASPDAADLRRVFDQVVARLVASGLDIMDQPSSSLARHVLTRASHGIADPRDAGEGSYFRRGDFIHMKPSYGRLVIDQYRATRMKASA